MNQAGLVVRDRINNLDYQLERVAVEERHMSDGETSQAVLNLTNDGPTQVLPQPFPREVLDIFGKLRKATIADTASHRIGIGKVTQGADAEVVVGVHGLENVNGLNGPCLRGKGNLVACCGFRRC